MSFDENVDEKQQMTNTGHMAITIAHLSHLVLS